jgi:hypothetical protein
MIKMSALPYCRLWSNNTGVGRAIDSDRIITFGLKGSSDILGIYKGRLLCIEVKTGNARQSKQQINFQKMIDSQYGIYVICRDSNVQQIDKIVEHRFKEIINEHSLQGKDS